MFFVRDKKMSTEEHFEFQKNIIWKASQILENPIPIKFCPLEINKRNQRELEAILLKDLNQIVENRIDIATNYSVILV